MPTRVEITTKKNQTLKSELFTQVRGIREQFPSGKRGACGYLYCSMSSLLPSRSTGLSCWQPRACRARTSR